MWICVGCLSGLGSLGKQEKGSNREAFGPLRRQEDAPNSQEEENRRKGKLPWRWIVIKSSYFIKMKQFEWLIYLLGVTPVPETTGKLFSLKPASSRKAGSSVGMRQTMRVMRPRQGC